MINAVNPNIANYNVNNLSNQQIKQIKDNILAFCNGKGVECKNIVFGPNKSIVFSGVDKDGKEFKIFLDAKNLNPDQIVSELKNKIESETEGENNNGQPMQHTAPDFIFEGNIQSGSYLWKFVLDTIDKIRSNIREYIIEQQKENEELDKKASEKKMEKARELERHLKKVVENGSNHVQQIKAQMKELVLNGPQILAALKSDLGDDRKTAVLVYEIEKNMKELIGLANAVQNSGRINNLIA